MVKISWKQTEVNEFSEEDKTKLIDEMKHKSMTEEQTINKEAARRIKHDIEVMANSNKLKLEKDGDQFYLNVYGIQFYYPGPDGKLSGSADATGAALDYLKKILLKLSNHVTLKVVEGGTRYEYRDGAAELDPDLFDTEEADREEFL
ncbi:MAG: hypothetical protein EPN86_02005 [Nanoarchaeota archaeon]|nr:MAG: hypothetical protein EPN86_02005 [Nanoarchaeota archaeon]